MSAKQSCLIIVFALSTGFLWGALSEDFIIDNPAIAQETTRSGEAGSFEFLQGLTPNLARLSGNDWVMEQRIASALQKVGKNLILEQTRGVKDIAVYRNAAPGVVMILTKESLGSGSILDKEGHVLTNYHVVENYTTVAVLFKPENGEELTKDLVFKATVEKIDEVSDLALLRINKPPKNLTYLTMGNIGSLAIGMDVHAIGHPSGEVWTYTKGIISQIRANYEWTGNHRAKVIQTQTPINPGNSGGPLLNDEGKLIGINSFRLTGEGLNYAVAVDELKTFLQRPGSRASEASSTKDKLQCSESYPTGYPGLNDIEGCYLSMNRKPPPEMWWVSYVTTSTLSYGAMGGSSRNKIDTIFKQGILQNDGLDFFVDTDCDGTVDIIAHQNAGSTDFDSYRAPTDKLQLVLLAGELDRAIKSRKIPYSSVQVCQ